MKAGCSPGPETPVMAVTAWISTPFLLGQALCIGTILLMVVAMVVKGPLVRFINTLGAILVSASILVGTYLFVWSVWIDRNIPTSRPHSYLGLFCLTGVLGFVALVSLVFVIWKQARFKPQSTEPNDPGIGLSLEH
jgi:hypothetical protein